ncbi:MAG: hypothetical protein BGO26_00280 [Actinobacteria bacterium 69-20]|jgi:hypothetical protein|nr:MAG: hypothetical protein BGO26_00280 [Actinobacteria bacterium 69-20]
MDEAREDVPRLRPARRRRANASTRRTHAVQVKVDADEYLRLRVEADARGISIPRLLVESTFAGDVGLTASERQQLAAELFRLTRLAAALSNNINQMTKAANATGEVPAEAAPTIAYLRGELLPRLHQALGRLVDR